MNLPPPPRFLDKLFGKIFSWKIEMLAFNTVFVKIFAENKS